MKIAINAPWQSVDRYFLLVIAAIMAIGLVMMSSAAIDFSAAKYGTPFYFLVRQSIFLLIAIFAGVAAFFVPTDAWLRQGWILLLAAFVLLVAVLIPGVGREVNGSMRWIPLGFVNLQCSELAKLFVLIYLAGYLVRRQDEVRESISGFAKPIVVLIVMVGLLILEPDFGSVVVLGFASMGMIFLGGVSFRNFTVTAVLVGVAGAFLAVSSAYRLQRLNCFLDPWAHPYDCGYQLTQSLIAFGRGEWFGLGLGNSIQKMFYLPEAHTDFVFAIIAEELGFVGGLVTVLLFTLLVGWIMKTGKAAQNEGRLFDAYLSYGIGLLLAAQVFINIGVNTGVLPTKGLTLPFMSYGGSSLIVTFIMMGIMARIDSEMAHHRAASSEQNAKARKNV